MIEPLACLNGRFLPRSEARLEINDAGFVFGATATDLCRTFRHRLFRLSDHIERFQLSCRLARVRQSLSNLELAALAERLVEHNTKLLAPEQDLALVMFATPGPIGYYAGEEGGPGEGIPTLCLHTFPLPFRRYAPLFRQGARLVVPSMRHVPSICVSPQAKQRSRLHWWIAEQEAKQIDPAASALLLDLDGHVTETAAANFLIVRQGTVLSPRRESILGGISLKVVEDLCRELRIPFKEQPLSIDDCLAAEEAMLTSTPYCVAGISHINGQPIPWPGPVWQRLLHAWSQKVGTDIAAQITKST